MTAATQFSISGEDPLLLRPQILNDASLRPYYRFRDIERLDALCPYLEEWYLDSLLVEVAFPHPELPADVPGETLTVHTNQYLLGNLRSREGEPLKLVFLDFQEEWGASLFIASFQTNGKMIDVSPLCGYGEYDESGFSSQLTFEAADRYGYEEIDSIHSHSYPQDTVYVTRRFGSLELLQGGLIQRTQQLVLQDTLAGRND